MMTFVQRFGLAFTVTIWSFSVISGFIFDNSFKNEFLKNAI